MNNNFTRTVGLYQQVAAALRQEIRQHHQPGDRLESVRQLAAQLKVSCNTLRGALAVLAREGLVESQPGRGVFVRPAARPEACVAILSELDISDPGCSYFFRRVPQTLRLFLRQHGVASRLYIGHIPAVGVEAADAAARVCHEFYQDLEAGRFQAVVEFNTSVHTQPRFHEAMATVHMPYVPAGSSGIDFDGLLRQGLARLRQAGRQRIAVLGHFADGVPEAIRRALAEAGLACNPAWIRGDLHPASPGAGWEELMEIWAARREKPDGLLVTDDILFNDASKAILALHLAVPAALHVVTHSNRGSGIYPPFAADRLEIDPDVIAAGYGRRVLELLTGQAPAPALLRVPPELVVAPPVALPSRERAPVEMEAVV